MERHTAPGTCRETPSAGHMLRAAAVEKVNVSMDSQVTDWGACSHLFMHTHTLVLLPWLSSCSHFLPMTMMLVYDANTRSLACPCPGTPRALSPLALILSAHFLEGGGQNTLKEDLEMQNH